MVNYAVATHANQLALDCPGLTGYLFWHKLDCGGTDFGPIVGFTADTMRSERYYSASLYPIMAALHHSMSITGANKDLEQDFRGRMNEFQAAFPF